MTEKMKKRLAIAGASAIGLALVVAIGLQFQKAPVEPDTLPQQPQNSASVAPEVQKPEVVVTPPSVSESQPAESLPPQTDLPEQKLQLDPVKPEAPSEPPKSSDGVDRTPPADKDHNFTPESPDTPPTYKPEETEKKPAPTPEPSKPQGGGGLPGFDNVPDGGANQVIEVDGDGDINKQVGTMD